MYTYNIIVVNYNNAEFLHFGTINLVGSYANNIATMDLFTCAYQSLSNHTTTFYV